MNLRAAVNLKSKPTILSQFLSPIKAFNEKENCRNELKTIQSALYKVAEKTLDEKKTYQKLLQPASNLQMKLRESKRIVQVITKKVIKLKIVSREAVKAEMLITLYDQMPLTLTDTINYSRKYKSNIETHMRERER